MALAKKTSLVQSIRDTLITLDNARNIVFYYVVLRYIGKSVRHLRSRGVKTTLYECYSDLAQYCFKLLMRIPSAKKKVNLQLDAATIEMQEKIAPRPAGVVRWLQLPVHGKSLDWLTSELDTLSTMPSSDWSKGRVSGAVYHGGKDMEHLISTAFSKFVVSNPLHPDIFPGIRKMEAEVIQMVLDMYNAPQETGCGTMTGGGTESILMACKTYRDWARETKGIREPEMVIPCSAHAAFDKAGEYFGIKVHHVPVHRETRKVQLKSVKRAINKNTIMIVGSACNFPDGAVDDISSLSLLAQTYKIGLHVDCCLGSFLVPFLERAGFHMDAFDFRLPGVTSISCDPHKYGFAPKGSSVIMYRDTTLRKFQYSVYPKWAGGVYASPSIAGSRPGALIAGTWAALMYMGNDGYIESCRQIVGAAKKLESAIRHEVPELRVMGQPLVSVVAFETVEGSGVNIYELGDWLSQKGWHLNALQHPAALHIACTRPTVSAVDDLISDLKQAVIECKGTQGGKGSMVTLYGLGSSSAVGPGLVKEMASRYLDVVLSA